MIVNSLFVIACLYYAHTNRMTQSVQQSIFCNGVFFQVIISICILSEHDKRLLFETNTDFTVDLQ